MPEHGADPGVTKPRTPGQREGGRQLREAVASIADVVHEAVCHVYGPENAHEAVIAYALVGARVMTTHGLAMMPQAGLLAATTKTSTSTAGYWAWMIRDPAGPGIKGVEIADFAMRHVHRAITAAGITWDLEPVPLWYCGPVHDLASFGIAYHAEDGSREAIEQHAPGGADRAYDHAMAILNAAG
jgi:hypothetical protein